MLGVTCCCGFFFFLLAYWGACVFFQTREGMVVCVRSGGVCVVVGVLVCVGWVGVPGVCR